MLINNNLDCFLTSVDSIDDIASLIEINKFQNIYLYIDVFVYGIKSENVDARLVIESGSPQILIYEYYGSLQLMKLNSTLSEAPLYLLVNYIKSKSYKRISGPSDILSFIFYNTNNYKITNGHIMVYEKSNECKKEGCEFATIDDLKEIAELIINEEKMGNSYEYEKLYSQLVERFLNDGCKNLIIRRNGKIVSHFASYAIMKSIVVLSGMVTKKEYRGRGFGTILVKYLSEFYLARGITPVLYCYEDEYFTWYQKLGYKSFELSSKLEAIN